MKSFFSFFKYLFIILFILIILFINFKLLFTPGQNNLEKIFESAHKQLNFLEPQVHEKHLAEQMQYIYPEGYVFANVLYGLSWTEISKKPDPDSILFLHAQKEANYALARLQSDSAKTIFDKQQQPEYGIFYRGWVNYLLGKMIQAHIVKDTISINLFKQNCAEIAAAFSNATTPYPDSYVNMSWPADACVAMASLQLYNKLYTPLYDTLIQNWIENVKVHLDTATGLIPHQSASGTGNTLEGARGSSMSLILIFLAEIDPVFAQQQFVIYQKQFQHTILGLPAIREYPAGTSGTGDIDSGPVVFGMSFTGTIVGIGTFAKFGATNQSRKLSACTEAFGFPVSFNNKKQFALGKFPIADMFIVWSRLQAPEPGLNDANNDYNFGTTLWLHLSSLIILAIMVYRFWRKKLKQQRS